MSSSPSSRPWALRPRVVMFFALGDRSQRILGGLRDWMGQHNAVIMAVICLIIGAKLIGDAIGGFSS